MLESSIHHQLPESLWRQAPLFPYLICCFMGGVIGTFAGFGVIGWAVSACICSAISIISYLRLKNNGNKRFVPWMFASLAIIFSLASLTQNAWQEVKVDWNDKQQIWLGHVVNIQKKSDKSCVYDVELRPSRTQKKRCNVRIFLKDNHAGQPKIGEEVAFIGTIKIKRQLNYPGEFDFSNYLLTHHISGYCYVKDGYLKVLPAQEPFSFKVWMLRMRQELINTYTNYFGNSDLAILSALTLGDKSMLTADTRNMFSQTGTNHILALSGLHLSILFAVFNLIFTPIFNSTRRTRYVSSACILLMLWMFVLLSGCSQSLIRAAYMLSFLQLGRSIGRGSGNGINNLSLSGIIILLCDPLALFDVSFQLSFAAVFAILLANQYVWRRYPLPTWTKKSKSAPSFSTKVCKSLYIFFRNIIYPVITISLSAQWGTFPLVAHYFHTFSPYAIVANFVVIPAAYLLLCGALLFFITPIATIQTAIAYCMEHVLSALTNSLKYIGSWPGSMLHVHATIFTLLLIIVLPIIVYTLFETKRRKIRKKLIITFFSFISLSLVIEYIYNTTQSIAPCIIVYKTPHSTIIHFVQSKQVSYLFSNNDKKSTQTKLSYIKQNFWQANDMIVPLWLMDTKNIKSSHHIFKSGNLIVFNNKRIYILSPNCHFTENTDKTIQPLQIDILVVDDRCNVPFKTIATHLTPQLVVLPSSLSTRIKKTWKHSCKQANIPCWNIYDNGAFIKRLSKKNPLSFK